MDNPFFFFYRFGSLYHSSLSHFASYPHNRMKKQLFCGRDEKNIKVEQKKKMNILYKIFLIPHSTLKKTLSGNPFKK